MPVPMKFSSPQEARTYRYLNNAGGWIFVSQDGGEVLLFPPEVSPIMVFRHPMTAGRVGDLLAP